jgi:hypothetical protein
VKAEDFDHPIVYVLTITMCVIGVTALMSWGFSSLGWTGPLGLLKGGVVTSGT